MKSNIECLSSLERKLNIRVSAQEVNTEFNKMFNYLQKNVENKGFRKGKTPMTVIRKLYSEKIKGDVTQGLVEHFYPKALKEHNLTPSGGPDIDCQNAKENKEFSFSACFETFPEIREVNIGSLEVKKEKMNIDDHAVNQNIENILKNEATMEDVILIRELKHGDFADIDFFPHRDDLMENYSMKNHILEIGSDSFFIPDFEKGLLGMKPGEKRVLDLTFPDDSQEKNLCGEKVKFEVTLNKIKKKIQPELNDEFVKKISSCQTVEEFKNNLKKNLIETRERHIKEDLKEKIFHALVKANPFEVPKSLLKRQYSDFSNRIREQMKDAKISEEAIARHLETQKETLSERAEFTLKCGLLIRKIIEENNLKVTEEDFEDYLKEFANKTGTDLTELERQFINKEDTKKHIESEIIEKKVFELLLTKAKVTSVDVGGWIKETKTD